MDAVTVRRAGADDLPAILAVAGRSLGWEPGAQTEAHFRWKHRESPFGPSPMWIAETDGRVAGFRTFLRWEFRAADGTIRRAVRAVDTATDPDFQGRGIFTRLTTGALDDLRAEGVEFVFNTPNSQSRPGYLKMGWREVGRLPVAVRPTGVVAVSRIARARTAADRGALACTLGEDAATALGDRVTAAGLLAAGAPPTAGEALQTARTPEYLAWRYGPAHLHYRVVRSGDGRTAAVFHLRRRGPAVEAVVCDVLGAPDDRRGRREVLGAIARGAGADYLIRLHTPAEPLAPGFVPVPRLGPVLTARDVAAAVSARPAHWWLTLGDIELF